MPRSPKNNENSAPKPTHLAAELLRWYTAHRRDLPWRRTSDPYAIWVSEVMLQQTQVETVRPYYARWLNRFPNIRELASAEEADVLKLWQGLGYYSRARRLLAGARAVVAEHKGSIPESVEELLKLPGIGPYSAGAIASIAFNQAVPLVDGNVVRVITRLFGLRGDPTRAPLKSEIWKLAEQLIAPGRARDSNQALMEFGALVCTPQKPLCLTCPLHALCEARKRGLTQTLPELPARQAVTQVAMVAALIQRRGRFLVYQVPEDAPRWAGMWQFPNVERKSKETATEALVRLGREQLGGKLQVGEHAATLKHSVTRYRITLEAHYCTLQLTSGGSGVRAGHEGRRGNVAATERPRVVRWCSRKELAELPLPAVHRKLAGISWGGWRR
ncbi:MAG: A/G-specific adenine glycosylase [Polyangiaceae bacterium]|nr:A/G-specific adenine glycosylase [Polyangiaceae bacterium]